MSGKAAKVILTEQQEGVLQQISRSTTAPERLVQRAGIILLAFAGWLNWETVKRPATWKESWASRRQNSGTLALVA